MIASHKKWLNKNKEILKKYNNKKNIHFCYGGKSRNESISESVKYLEKNFKLDNNDILITHDANRIFINNKIINENIQKCKKYGCVLTGIPSVDTIYKYKNKKITNILIRDELFNSQTPQTFNYEKLKKIINSKQDHLFHKTDLGTMAFLNNEDIHICNGSSLNFKITYMEDFEIAKRILKNK